MDSLTIEELIISAKIGDQQAFEEIVRRTYKDSYSLAFRMLGNEEDASDVVQEVYIKVHRSLSKFRGDSKFSTWLYRITANCANTHFSRHKKHAHEQLFEDSSQRIDLGDNTFEDTVNVIHIQSDISRALQLLPMKLRSVVVLRDIYDLTHEQISKELDISTSATKVRLHRGRQKLREILYPMYRLEMSDADAM